MRSTWWDKGLRLLVSATLVLGLVPTPALAEAVDDVGLGDLAVDEAIIPESENSEAIEAVDTERTDEVPQASESKEGDEGLELQSLDELQPMAIEEDAPDVSGLGAEDDGAADVELAPMGEAVTPIETGKAYTVEVDEDIAYWLGEFTAPADGTYTFWSEGGYDTYGELYPDLDLNDRITYDDDGGSGNNFKISYSLTAGQTVYLKVRQFSSNSMSCTIHVEDSNGPSITGLSDLSSAVLYFSHGYMYYSGSTDASWTGGNVDFGTKVEDASGKSLQEGIDYVLEYEQEDEEYEWVGIDYAPILVGSYRVRAVAAEGSGYKGSTSWSYVNVVDPNDISSRVWNSEIFSLSYTGTPVSIDRVTFKFFNGAEWEDVDLILGRDYVITGYRDNSSWETIDNVTEVGSYIACLEGIGEYEGSRDIDFEVQDASNLSSADIDVETTWGSLTPEVTVWDSEGNTLVEGSDYVLVYGTSSDGDIAGTPSASGDYYVYAKAIEGGSYTGQTGSLYFSVGDAHDISSWNCYVYFDGIGEAAYTGEEIIPSIDVCYHDGARGFLHLTEGEDYELVGYLDSSGNDVAKLVECGTYRAVLRGIGSYHGEKETSPFSIIDSHDISNCEVYLRGASENISYGLNYYDVYFLRGGSVEPEVSVGMLDGYLVEGVDYVLSYADNTSEGVATVTVTGVGSCHGSVSKRFCIVDKIDISSYLNYCGVLTVRLGSKSRYWYGGEGNHVSFQRTGYAMAPTVSFSKEYYEPGFMPVLGRDFTISYLDAAGNAIAAPAEEGSYYILLSATSDGILSGSMRVPFSIIEPASSSLGWASVTVESHGSSTSARVYGFDGLISLDEVLTDDELMNLSWSMRRLERAYDDEPPLVEGLDFTVNSLGVRDKVYHRFSLDGISYEGSLNVDVYVPTAQEVFSSRRVSVNELSYAAPFYYVYLDSKGNLIDPTIRVSGLVRGMDYAYAGLVSTDDLSTVTKASVGSELLVKLVGLGDYAGCERYEWVKVHEGSAWVYSLSDDGVSLSNTYYAKGERVALRSASSSVSAFVYGGRQFLLENGHGLSVTRELSSDGNVLELTVTGDELGLAQGSTKVIVNLVDKLDLSEFVGYVYVKGLTGNTTFFEIGGPNPVVMPYAGFSYVPSVTVPYGLDPAPTYSVSLRNSKGSTVSGITGAGSYALVLTGTGDWEGSVEVPLQVVAQDSVDLSECTVTLGDAVLSGGKAEPAVSVTFGTHAFSKGTDYTVSYGNNTSVGSKGYVKISAVAGGKLNGVTALSFDVLASSTAKDLSAGGYTLMLKDENDNSYYAPTGTARSYKATSSSPAKPAVKVVDASGKTLSASNYEVSYLNNSAEGYGYVTVTGKGSYDGSLTGTFYVIGPKLLEAIATTTGTQVGKTARFSCEVAGADGSKLTYQWQFSKDGGKTWSNSSASGAKTAAYSLEATQARVNGQVYRCVVTAADGRTATSNTISYRLIPDLVANAGTFEVTLGDDAEFYCYVDNEEGAELSYQWQFSKDGGKTWSNSSTTGAKTSWCTIKATVARATGQLYRCVVTADDGRTATSDAVGIKIAISATASTEKVDLDSTATFTCSVVDSLSSSLTYQWQFSRDGGKTWNNASASSAKTANHSVQANTDRVKNQLWRCVVTAADGRVAMTQPIAFVVRPVLEASAYTSPVVVGDTARFRCIVGGLDGCSLTYQWQWSRDGGKTWSNSSSAGSKTAVCSIQATDSRVKSQTYRCVVTSSDGRTANTDALGFDAQLAATAATSAVQLGQTATFTCSVRGASGVKLSYQWQFSRDNGKTWNNASASGAKTASYSTQATESRVLSQIWRCQVTAADGRTATTKSIAFDVVPELEAYASTSDVVIGDSAKFRCTVSGAGGVGLSFQWQWSKDDGKTWANSSAAGSDTAICSIQATDSRAKSQTYRCVVTADDGRTATSEAVGFDIRLVATASTAQVALNQNATFTCKVMGAVNAKLSYQWQFSRDGGETWNNASASGAKTASYTTQATSSRVNSQVWRCQVTASDGRTATTDAVTFDVA